MRVSNKLEKIIDEHSLAQEAATDYLEVTVLHQTLLRSLF